MLTHSLDCSSQQKKDKQKLINKIKQALPTKIKKNKYKIIKTINLSLIGSAFGIYKFITFKLDYINLLVVH